MCCNCIAKPNGLNSESCLHFHTTLCCGWSDKLHSQRGDALFSARARICSRTLLINFKRKFCCFFCGFCFRLANFSNSLSNDSVEFNYKGAPFACITEQLRIAALFVLRGQLKIHLWKMRGCRGVATGWKGEEGTEDFFSVRSDTHHWWVWVLLFSVSVGPFEIRDHSLSFRFIYKSSQMQIKFAIKMIVGKCDSPEDLCSLWTRARALNNITKQFSRLSRRRNIHTKNQHFRYYISETQLWPLARFALALCVCGKWWWETAIISAVMLLLLLLEHFFMKWNVVPLVRCN